MKNKSFLVFLLVFCMSFFSFACKKEEVREYRNVEAPNMQKMEGEAGLDFINMHNYVIDNMSQQYTPFFYIKNGEFDISGDNEKKLISVSCKCMNGTLKSDVDLFFSLVLQFIGYNAAEQDFRFKAPSIDNTGAYTDFGTVFDTYSLELYAENDDGTILYNNIYKNGTNIPIEPRYWSES